MVDRFTVSRLQVAAHAFENLLRISSCELKQSTSNERILKEMKERANEKRVNFAADEGPTRITTAVYSAMDMLGQVRVAEIVLITKFFIAQGLIVRLYRVRYILCVEWQLPSHYKCQCLISG